MRLTIRLLHEVASAYDEPVTTMAQRLKTGKALAIEVAHVRDRQAQEWAHALIQDKQPSPDGTRLIDSLARGYYAAIKAERDKQKAIEQAAAWDLAYRAQQARERAS